MDWFEALILGLVQGLTEFLPVSSSGHLELGKVLFGHTGEEGSLLFSVSVHTATVLSTLIVFRNDIFDIFKDVFKFEWNDSSKYFSMLLLSMIPVAILGVFFKDYVEGFFTGNTILVGSMLLVTAFLLALAHFIKAKQKKLTYTNTFLVGIAQAIAVLPGISRSGATISTGLLLGIPRNQIAKFSFLMVIIPILGESFLSLLKGDYSETSVEPLPIIIGFIAAFISGLFACSFMIKIVKKEGLIWFSIYCLLAGATAIILTFLS